MSTKEVNYSILPAGADDTLSGTIDMLRQQGYSEDFTIQPDCLRCVTRQLDIKPEDFHIDALFRFEGMTNPDDEEILLAISSDTFKVKGILINAYGVYADVITGEMERKLKY